MKNIGFAGAGLTNAVIARELAERGHHCTLFDSRSHIGGNCYTERDPNTGVMIHKYGPHIFHTRHEQVWNFVNRFAEMMPFVNRVKARVGSTIYSLPVNLHTINQFFNRAFGPEEARAFVESLCDKEIIEPENFEQMALSLIGRELYEAFFYGYTKKQWGVEPTEIAASVLKRLPLRFNYDDNYYDHPYQAIPKEGYTAMIAEILNHPSIEVILNETFEPRQSEEFDHTFWSGPIDAFFKGSHGNLRYRTVYWSESVHSGDYQGTAVINYPGMDVPYTRIHEHKHFAPWETHEKTNVFVEYSKLTEKGDIPYYPLGMKQDKVILQKFQEEAKSVKKVTFVGRLGTYRYLDMDTSILEALKTASEFQSSPD